jgi:ribosomal protein L35AE/L33A
MPYLCIKSDDGYLFGLPQKALGDSFVIKKNCYEVNGTTGKIRRLHGEQTIIVERYRFFKPGH